MKRLSILLLAIIFTAASTQAQSYSVSPFKRMHKPGYGQNFKMTYGITPVIKTTVWRFSAAAASFDPKNNRILTGVGFGINNMHSITDSTGASHWYTDFTANFVVYASGSTTPSYSNGQTNIIAGGPSVGFFNKLVNFGWAFYPPSNGGKWLNGPVLGIYLPLN